MDYLPIDADGSSLLFQLIARRYEQGSTIVTSNLSFGHWGSFLENDVVASAILDRLLHHGSIVNLRGESGLRTNAVRGSSAQRRTSESAEPQANRIEIVRYKRNMKAVFSPQHQNRQSGIFNRKFSGI
jgi:hypothetical protein